ncbi:uncharacterized protein [Dysidea avara]|uniref:uncharacterized protein n=1 Tax=Dysidea avara TaxID=196820 RepID=UPI003318735F
MCPVPCLISTVCSIFIRRGGAIVCVITGPRQYTHDLPQGGLEVPCPYIFRTKDCKLGEKAKKVVEDVFGVMIIPTDDSPRQPVDDDGSHDVAGKDDGSPDAVFNHDHPLEAERIFMSTDVNRNISAHEIVITDDGESSSEPPCKKARISDIDPEYVIMGEELSDIHINLAQSLLKAQFPELSGLKSTLLQQKETPELEKQEKMLQIIHCASRLHWIVATTVGSAGNAILIYDSAFRNADEETRETIYTLFKSLAVIIINTLQ